MHGVTGADSGRKKYPMNTSQKSLNKKRRCSHGKILLLTLDEQEEKAIDKIIAATTPGISKQGGSKTYPP